MLGLVETWRGRASLDFDLDAEFDDAVRREPEESRRAHGIPGHQHEETLTPLRHAGVVADEDRFPAEEERDVFLVDPEAQALGEPQGLGHIRVLGEAVPHQHVRHAFPKLTHLDLFIGRHVRHLRGQHREYHHLLVEHLVVTQVVHQRGRRALCLCSHED